MSAKFQNWINQRYEDFRAGKIGNEASIQKYADYLGVSHQTASNWLRGSDMPRSQKSIARLYSIYGLEIYTILGIEPPDIIADIESAYRALGSSDDKRLLLGKIRALIQDLESEPSARN